MSVLVVVNSPEDATPLVTWAARFAAARNHTLTVLCPSRAASSQPAKDLALRDPDDDNPLRKAVRAAIVHAAKILVPDDADSELEIDLEQAATDPTPETSEQTPKDLREEAENEPEDGITPKLDELPKGLGNHVGLVGLADPDVVAGTLTELKRRSATLTVIGHDDGVRGEDVSTSLAGLALESLPGEVMILRASGESGERAGSILLPTSGGPHAAIALKLAHEVVKRTGGRLVPLRVATEFGELSEDVGHLALKRSLKSAGIKVDVDHVTPRVIVSDKPQKGIAQAASEGHDLLIVGASDTNMLRRALFGTVPERVLSESQNLAVGVFRRARPLTSRTWEAFVRTLSHPFPNLTREERMVLFTRLGEGSAGDLDFMVLIALSTAIACLGLLQDSTAVVIGAMLVAPLMTPMIGAGFAMVQGNLILMRRAVQTIVTGFLIALGIGAGFGLIYFQLAPDIGLTHEILARGQPNVLDLVVAFLSGLAAAYALARPKLMGAMAGVAIAAALVPPIGSAGLAFAAGEFAVGRGAAMLFGVNLLAIVLGAAVAFGGLGIRAQRQSSSRLTRWGGIILLLITGLVAIPLSSVLISSFSRKTLERTVRVTPGLTLALERELIVLEREALNTASLSLIDVRNLRVSADADLKVVVATSGAVPATLLGRLAGAAERAVRHPVRLRLVLVHADWVGTSEAMEEQ